MKVLHDMEIFSPFKLSAVFNVFEELSRKYETFLCCLRVLNSHTAFVNSINFLMNFVFCLVIKLSNLFVKE